MKNILVPLFLLLLIGNFTACNYLDVVPDEREEEEDAYKDADAAQGFLYSCYSYIPVPNDGSASLDFMTGDEVVTSFEHETFANFPKGNFTAANPIISYWNKLFGGIRQCYKLLNLLDNIPGIEEYKEEYEGELKFLIGYYHMLLFRCYGPIIIVRDEMDINTNPDNYSPRSPLNECVDFIVQCFDEAADKLPATRTGTYVGRATSIAAKSLKAYTLLYYASPLFNGNADLVAQFDEVGGNGLLDATYDATRWERARDAYKEAIEAAETAGHALFTTETSPMTNVYPQNTTLRVLRANLCTPIRYNTEEIWTRYYEEGTYGMQKKSMPFTPGCYNGVSPTMNMLRRFYTVNGLPYDVDPLTKDKNEFDVVSLDDENSIMKFADGTTATVAESGEQTSFMNLNREPRYYAWIAFQSGFYEVTNASNNGGYDSDETMAKYNDGQLVTNFLRSGNCGRKERNNNYPPTGFLNKKGVHPDNTVNNNSSVTLHIYPFPIVRLAELYLGYAECAAECGDAATAKEYTDLIRVRAGIPTVDESWSLVGIVPDAEQMVDIVRQERQIELYLECKNFWDMRRWLLAEENFNHKHTGMNIEGETMEAFSVETEVPFERVFRHNHYLLPIPAADINNNHNVVQNPGY